MPFICECSDERCTRVVTMPLAEHAAMRARPDRYLVVPGHERSEEHVVELNERFTVVQAQDAAAEHGV